MQRWIWIDPEVLLAVHEEQLAEHGGAAGIRDQELFESALARPQHVDAYGLPEGGEPSAADLSAFYLHGLACNHPFVDGNKRTALVAAELFLELNEFSLNASDEECVLLTLSVAAGKNSEEEITDFVKQRLSNSRLIKI